MEDLLAFQHNILVQISDDWHRYLFPELDTAERLLGIRGLRGVGKTTMMLQYLKYRYPNPEKALYVTADHPYFYSHTLFDLGADWYRHGGTLLMIDEVHKYANWSRELKLIYDGHPDLRVVFTSSSALDLYRGESDLSRRLSTLTLPGLSFREYLGLGHGIVINRISIQELLQDARHIAAALSSEFKPLPLFKAYLRDGYFPFIKAMDKGMVGSRLLQIVNTVLESDLAFSRDYSPANIQKIKKLLGAIASSAPFEPNVSALAQKLGIGRNTVVNYLKHLNDAHILILLRKSGKGTSALQKPDKIYFENTAFAFTFQETPNTGTIRETFIVNQLINAGHSVTLGSKADFIVNDHLVLEVGGKQKDMRQIRDTDGYLALDGIEVGFDKKIPLWLFGFLY